MKRFALPENGESKFLLDNRIDCKQANFALLGTASTEHLVKFTPGDRVNLHNFDRYFVD
jgi:hypothetical protein